MRNFLAILFFLWAATLYCQLDESCKLSFGTNLGGLADYGTELPFVDLMHNARTWYTKDVENPNAAFNSEQAQNLSFRSDGYPTHIPQVVEGVTYQQKVVTIWAITDGWPEGRYTVLWDGTGTLSFWGGIENLQNTNEGRIIFDFENAPGSVVEMTIESSNINDPVHNIRVLMPGTETTYESDPFNPLWIDKLSIFPSVRFMDWGVTNNWGQDENDPLIAPGLFSWDERAQMDHYTWADKKGIPYEMMIKLMNDYDIDGWVCVPHKADDSFISEMATLFHDNLEEDRHLTVEYSNEIWNWIFAQTQWLNEYGCIQKGVSWPEGIVPYIQNCLDKWTEVYQNDLSRITRVVGVQVSWQDVSNRIVNNMTPGSFDAITPTYYFGFTEAGDSALDQLADNATTNDIAYYAREGMEAAKAWLNQQKTELADPLGVPLVFYEGGQHLTGHPFGVEPSYANALLEIQRDTAMYNMYNEWFTFIKTLQSGNEPLQLMNFSFISNRNAQYGSWGILETMDQDLDLIPAPKFQAIKEHIDACAATTNTHEIQETLALTISPNPTVDLIHINVPRSVTSLNLFDSNGRILQSLNTFDQFEIKMDLSTYPAGIYFLRLVDGKNDSGLIHKVIKLR